MDIFMSCFYCGSPRSFILTFQKKPALETCPLRENILHFPTIQEAPHFVIKCPTLNKKPPLWKKAPLFPLSPRRDRRSSVASTASAATCSPAVNICFHMYARYAWKQTDREFIWQIPGNCDLLQRSHRESWPLIGSCGLSRQRLGPCLTCDTLQTLNVRTRRVSALWPLCAAQQVTCDPSSDINRKSCSPRSFRWLADVRPHPIIPCESIPENQKWK